MSSLLIKPDFACSICSKILKNPIILPCFHNICEQHIRETSFSKEKSTFCITCNANINFENHLFGPNIFARNLLDKQAYLSEEEKSQKVSLEENLQRFFSSSEKYLQEKLCLESVSKEHFNQIRLQLDSHRKHLMERIENIYTDMIKQTETVEKWFNVNLNKQFETTDALIITDKNARDEKILELDETFRKINLEIISLRAEHIRREDTITKISLKINKINQLKDELKVANEFKPNSSFERNSFGLLSFPNSPLYQRPLLNREGSNEFMHFSNSAIKIKRENVELIENQIVLHSHTEKQSNQNGSIEMPSKKARISYFKSKILDEFQENRLIELCEFSHTNKWSLLYRASLHGFGAKDFHAKCDGQSPTLIILTVKPSTLTNPQQAEFIFGGFTEATWESCPSNGQWKSDPNAFIFSLTNKENKPCKIKTSDPNRSIYCLAGWGPIFGQDIYVKNNSNQTADSHSDLGSIYKHSGFARGSSQAQSFLAGSRKFQLSEIEVFTKE